ENYAHKLGLGRPLGMGSVRINECKIKLCNSSINNIEQTAIQALVKDIRLSDLSVNAHVCRWLDLHTYRCDDQRRFDYPRGEEDGKIHTWHTSLRREYSKLRRQNESKN